MNVSTAEVPPRQLALDIEVEQARLDSAIEQATRRFAQQVNIPGFRRGKAPRQMVERYVGRDRIVEDALEHLVPDVVGEAIQQENVQAYGTPKVESVEFDPFRVRAVVPLAPHVELGKYATDLRVDLETAEVDSTQIDAVVDRLRDSNAQWVPVERAAAVADRVGIDVRADVSGREQPLMDTKDAEFVMDPTGPEPAPGFTEKLVGMVADQTRSFSLALPEDYRDTDLAGAEVAFAVTLHWAKAKELPELDEVFAQQVGDYPDIAAMRVGIEVQLREREDQRVSEQNQQRVLEKLTEISTLEYPPQVVEHQTDHLLETFGRNVEQQGLKLDQYLRMANQDEAALRETMREQAERQIRRSLALDAFATAENVSVDDDEVDEELRKAVASAANQEQASTAAASAELRSRVRDVLRERKSMLRLMEIAATEETPTETKPSARASRKKVTATPSEEDTEPQGTDEPSSPAAQE